MSGLLSIIYYLLYKVYLRGCGGISYIHSFMYYESPTAPCGFLLCVFEDETQP